MTVEAREGDPMVTSAFGMSMDLYESFTRTADEQGLVIYSGEKRVPVITPALREAFSTFLERLDAGAVEIPETEPIEEGKTIFTTVKLLDSVHKKMINKAEPLGLFWVDTLGRKRLDPFYNAAMRDFIKRHEGNPRR